MEFEKPKQLSYKEALPRAADLCVRTEKCRFDIELKCREWQLGKEDTTHILDYLIKEKFIDHQRYANSFVRDKFRFNKWGKIKLSYALKMKQIEDKFIREALNQLNEDQYQKVLSDLLSSKIKSVKETDPNIRRNKLLVFAQSRGFEVSEVLHWLDRS